MRSSRSVRAGWCLSAAAALVSVLCCGPDEQGHLVEGGSAAVPTWAVADAPEFSVVGGVLDGDSLFFAGVSGGAFVNDGDVLVTLRSGERRVVFLDRSGSIVSAVGREGDGPGELRVVSELFGSGSRVAIWDQRNRRISFFANRSFAGERTVDLPPGYVLAGVFEDGTVVSTPRPGSIGARQAEASGGAFAYVPEGERRPFFFWDRGGQPRRLLGVEEPPLSSLVLYVQGRARRRDGSSALPGSSCLPEPQWAVVEEEIVTADTERGTLLFLSRSGSGTVRPATSPRNEMPEEFVESVRGWIERTEREWGRATSESKQAVSERIGDPGDSIPSAWSAMFTDRSGRIWLRKADCNLSRTPPGATWEVVDRRGSPMGSVSLRPGMRLLAADGDRILVTTIDDLDVERIAVYRIRDEA